MLTRRETTLLLAGACTAAAQKKSASLTLVREGRPDYSICLSPDASPSEKHAAAELQRFVEEMSGARLPIVGDAGATGRNLVLVGRSRTLDGLGLAIPFDTLGAEGFALQTTGPHVAIVGGRERGTMYGVYAFLEKLGCRWFTAEVSRIPKLRTIALAPLNERQRPAFEYREPYFTEAFDKDWAARNRTNGQSANLDASTGGKIQYHPFVHSFEELVPPKVHFKEHPEYFSLIDGARREVRSQLCLTNRDVLRLAIEQVERWIADHPEATIFSVSQNDWEGWCECDACRAVEAEEGGTHSGPILRFVNAVAEAIGKRHPDKLIDTLAYWYSEDPPRLVRPRPNVRIRLCPIDACEAHDYAKCPRNAYFMKNLRAWSEITNQLYIWHYNTNFAHYLAPFPDFDQLATTMPLYHRHGVVGVFLEGAYAPGGGGENAELRSYVMARQLWDPAVDVNRTVDEFLDGVYGKSARAMRRYFDLLQAEARRGLHLWIFVIPPFSAAFLTQAQAIFREAEAAADNDAVRRRVRKARLPIDYLDLLRAKTYTVRGNQYAPADLASLTSRFTSFFATLRGFGITSIHEGRDLAVDERELAALRAQPVFTVENAAWRLDVAPGLDGRAIHLIEKRRNRDVLRDVESTERGYPNLGGLNLEMRNGYHSPVVAIEWQASVSPDGTAVVLTGTAANGIALRRTLRLSADGLDIETVATNGTAAAVPVALYSRLELEPGPIDDAVVSFRAQSGTAVNRKLIVPATKPSGYETWSGTDQPDGELRLGDRICRFDKAQVARTYLNWTAKGSPRAMFGHWSAPRELPAGGSVTLRVSLR
jgi:hypothetical protein